MHRTGGDEEIIPRLGWKGVDVVGDIKRNVELFRLMNGLDKILRVRIFPQAQIDHGTRLCLHHIIAFILGKGLAEVLPDIRIVGWTWQLRFVPPMVSR